MKEIKVNITDIEILKIDKLRKIKKNGLESTMKKLNTNLIKDILKSHTTLVESFLENSKQNILLLNQRKTNSYRR